nr:MULTISPECIES: Na+/H+ antiporter subunit E [unclassified Vibrio]
MLLALVWLVLSGNYTISNLFAGMIMSYAILAYLLRDSPTFEAYFKKLPKVISFGLFFIWDLIKANGRVAYDVLTPTHLMKPAVIAIPLELRDEGAITMFATLITVTPGSLALDVATDKSVLYVHLMYFEDEARQIEEFKRLEARVIDLLG